MKHHHRHWLIQPDVPLALQLQHRAHLYLLHYRQLADFHHLADLIFWQTASESKSFIFLLLFLRLASSIGSQRYARTSIPSASIAHMALQFTPQQASPISIYAHYNLLAVPLRAAAISFLKDDPHLVPLCKSIS
jgi:hypothetical protein